MLPASRTVWEQGVQPTPGLPLGRCGPRVDRSTAGKAQARNWVLPGSQGQPRLDRAPYTRIFLRELENYADCPELVGRCFLERVSVSLPIVATAALTTCPTPTQCGQTGPEAQPFLRPTEGRK